MNSLFHQWTNLLLHTLSNAVVMHHPSPQALSGSRVSGGSNAGAGTSEQRIKDKVRKELHTTVQDMMQPLMSWEKIHRGHCFKTIDTALLTIKLLQSTQPELFKTEDTNAQRNIDEYFKQLEFLATRTLYPQYFIEQNKHIISLEGLSGVGKSAILDLFVQHHELQFPGKYQKICVVQRNDNSIYSDLWEIFQQLPMFYQLLFQFLENYRIIYEIMVIQKDFNVFIIENYFHSFLTNFILSNESIISTKNDLTYLNYFHVASADEIEGKFPHSSLFDWPLDLPMPELVLYFTCPTLTRLQRKNLSDVSSSTILSKEGEDAIKTTLYSLVKGPGTIGIDTSGSFDEVFTTVFEALDYYGIYSITRPTVPLEENSNELPEVLHEGTEEVKDSDVMIEDQILKQKSFDFADVPMESQDVIYNRRISMGVYGMFSKFM